MSDWLYYKTLYLIQKYDKTINTLIRKIKKKETEIDNFNAKVLQRKRSTTKRREFLLLRTFYGLNAIFKKILVDYINRDENIKEKDRKRLIAIILGKK